MKKGVTIVGLLVVFSVLLSGCGPSGFSCDFNYPMVAFGRDNYYIWQEHSKFWFWYIDAGGELVKGELSMGDFSIVEADAQDARPSFIGRDCYTFLQIPPGSASFANAAKLAYLQKPSSTQMAAALSTMPPLVSVPQNDVSISDIQQSVSIPPAFIVFYLWLGVMVALLIVKILRNNITRARSIHATQSRRNSTGTF